MDKVNLAETLSRFSDHWHPRIVGELNGQHVKLVRVHGPFVWHRHAEADELFLVLAGTLDIELRDGVDHRPGAREEARVLVFEPAGTSNTGNVRESRTVERPERL